jgi:hypothetical protein
MKHFLKVQLLDETRLPILKETLTRMGIYTKSGNPPHYIKNLKQLCHIINSSGIFYLLHAKEIQGKRMQDIDYARRNTIAKMLETWGVLKVLNPEEILEHGTILSLFILPYKDKLKPGWQFEISVSVEQMRSFNPDENF